MDSNVPASFIPKKPLVQPGQVKSGGGTSYLLIIVVVVFVAVVLTGLAEFVYDNILQGNLTDRQQTLKTDLNQFKPSLVDQLSRLDSRIKTAGLLINKHISVSTLLKGLGDVTLKTLRYTDFSYSTDVAGNMKVSMGGQAQDFASVDLQLANFNSLDGQRYFKDVVFSNLSVDKTGAVDVSFSGSAVPDNIKYRSAVSANQGATLFSSPVINDNATSTGTTASSTAKSKSKK